MKNTFGNSISVTLFGESHGEEIGIVIDGIAPGVEINKEYIDKKLSLRRPAGKISTARQEPDNYRIVSGVLEGKATGTPICILIPNEDKHSSDYSLMKNTARPGHADFTANEKYHGFQDYRGGGHFSGRLTAPIVAAGAIAQSMLEKKNIHIGTHIKNIASIEDDSFNPINPEIDAINDKYFAVLNEEKGKKMKEAIEEAAKNKNSVGGILETAITGLPTGLGEPWFDSVESQLSHALFSIPAVKGVEFGKGFDFADMQGSEANDSFCIKDGKIQTTSNNNGGINGGITNGMPVLFKIAVKPTPSISLPQNTVDFAENKETVLELKGRHDPCIVHRARAVADAVTALVICDMLSSRFGTDYFTEG